MKTKSAIHTVRTVYYAQGLFEIHGKQDTMNKYELMQYKFWPRPQNRKYAHFSLKRQWDVCSEQCRVLHHLGHVGGAFLGI